MLVTSLESIHRVRVLSDRIEGPNDYKWNTFFYEMKGDVGMSSHEKERNKNMPTPRHKVTHNPIPTSLFLLTVNTIFPDVFCLIHLQ